jgi:hypothetical protein
MTIEQIEKEMSLANIESRCDYVRRLVKLHGESSPIVRSAAAYTLLMIAEFRKKWAKEIGA